MKTFEIELKYTCVREGDPVVCHKPEAVVEYMRGAFDSHPEQESVWVLLLDRRNQIKGRQMITLGGLSASICQPRDVFRAAILASAATIIVVHNHPSGDPTPSAADIQITRQLAQAGRTVDIPVSDHVIIGDKISDPLRIGFYSFKTAGMLV